MTTNEPDGWSRSSPRGTFYRWIREEKNGKPKPKNFKGGQRKPKEIRELVIEIAKTTGFGYTRIIGELRKLGIKKISRQTVRNILKEEGIQPAPGRTSDTWDNFIKRHAETLWAVDFFSVRTITTRGLRDMYVMVWLCMTSREVVVSDATEHPNSAWVVKQADLFVDQTAAREKKPDIIMHDRDTKFTKEFTARLKERGLRTNALPKASPNLNGRCERFVETIKLECLTKLIIFGKRHLDHLIAEFVESFPLLMGQTKTPACLLNGEAYSLGTKTKGKTRLWEVIEQTAHASKELLRDKVAAGLSADKPEREAQVLEQWAQQQAGRRLDT